MEGRKEGYLQAAPSNEVEHILSRLSGKAKQWTAAVGISPGDGGGTKTAVLIHQGRRSAKNRGWKLFCRQPVNFVFASVRDFLLSSLQMEAAEAVAVCFAEAQIPR